MSPNSQIDFRYLTYPALVGAAILFFIGVRFMLQPDGAAQTFGVAAPAKGYEFHYVIGLRDLWLALLAGAAALMRDWRSLALWFGFGALVCFADATIAAGSSGSTFSVTFHTLCGIACVVLAYLYARRATDWSARGE